MNKRIKRKQRKEYYKIYKGQSIAVNSPYSFGNYPKVMLCYCPLEGYELYVDKVSQVTKYLDSIHHEVRQFKRECKGYMDEIPF